MKYKKWTLAAPLPGAETIEAGGISPLLARVLAQKGCTTAEEARQVLSRGPELLHSPELMKDMTKAVARIRRAIAGGERICVYGDYDVDGITATCLLTARLQELGGDVVPYVPNRMSEGYSLNPEALLELQRQGVSLIVTVDCGITNLEETLYARSLGLDVVITDHHECKSQVPEAAAVVNPHQSDCPYPFQQLAGVGVALKLAMALAPEADREAVFREYSDLAAIGTVADVMELGGENRAIVAVGLEQLRRSRRPGLNMLLQEANLAGRVLTATTISYTLAPRLNAAGRMGCPELAVQLLLTQSEEEALVSARQLCQLNRDRQTVEQDIFQQCTALLEQHPSMREHAIILAGENWHQGVIGIVASRLVDHYQLPVFMICLENGRGKGSCRSNGGFSLFEALEQCSDLLDTFGGHALAAGFTIPEQNLNQFRTRITDIAAHAPSPDKGKELDIDLALPDLSLFTLDNVEALQALEPFGVGNPRPTFLMEGLELVTCSSVGGGRHTRLLLARDGLTIDAIFFSMALQEMGLRPGMELDVAFFPQVNEFRGNRTVQLLVTDLRRSLSSEQRELRLYRRCLAGELLTSLEVQRLLPQRRDFVALWRYLDQAGGEAGVWEAPEVLSRNVSRWAEVPLGCATTMVCLEVFRERGLIELTVEEHSVRARILPTSDKVDLNESPLLLRLRSALDN
jgi:single-stranded-DNA-specific exonuclease